MNLFSQIRELVIDNLHAMLSEGSLPRGLSFDNVAVEPPRDAAHGDMATNAAMVLAKPAKMKPREIADAIAGAITADSTSSVAVADFSSSSKELQQLMGCSWIPGLQRVQPTWPNHQCSQRVRSSCPRLH